MSSRFDNSLQTAGIDGAAGVRYKLMPGYPTLDWSNDETRATEKYLIKSEDVLTFLDECNYEADGFLEFRSLPIARAMPGVLPLMTRRVHFEPEDVGLPGDPFNADTERGVPDTTYVKNYVVTIEYIASRQGPTTPTELEPETPEDYVEHTMTSGGQALTISPHKLTVAKKDVFAGNADKQLQQDENGAINAAGVAFIAEDKENNTDLLQPIVKVIPTVEHTITYPAITAPDWRYLISCLGCVNSLSVESFMGTPLNKAEPETLLFLGFSANPKYSFLKDETTGNYVRVRKWELQYRITQRRIVETEVTEKWRYLPGANPGEGQFIMDPSSPVDTVYGWNHVWVPKQQKWRMVFQTVRENKLRQLRPIYRNTDFNVLLTNPGLV